MIMAKVFRVPDFIQQLSGMSIVQLARAPSTALRLLLHQRKLRARRATSSRQYCFLKAPSARRSSLLAFSSCPPFLVGLQTLSCARASVSDRFAPALNFRRSHFALPPLKTNVRPQPTDLPSRIVSRCCGMPSAECSDSGCLLPHAGARNR